MGSGDFPRFEEQRKRVDGIKQQTQTWQQVSDAASVAAVFVAYKYADKLPQDFSARAQRELRQQLMDYVVKDPQSAAKELSDHAINVFSGLVPVTLDAPDIAELFIDQLGKHLSLLQGSSKHEEEKGNLWPPNYPG